MRGSKKSMSERKFAFFLLLPTLLLMLALLMYPFIYSIYLSFVDLNLTRPLQGTQFVGFGNFQKIFNDSAFWNSLKLTFYYSFITVLGSLILGLLAALILNLKLIGRGFFRSLLLIPWATPLIIVGMIWKIILHPNYGALNSLLLKLGVIEQNIAWLTDPQWAFSMVILAEIWRSFPFVALLYLAALQTIPQDLYEAARIDGGNPWHTFRHITIPFLQSTTLVLLVLRTIDAFRAFDVIFGLTKGGPANKTEITSLYLYKQGFEFTNFGVSAAGSYFVTLFIFILVIVYVKVFKVEDLQ